MRGTPNIWNHIIVTSTKTGKQRDLIYGLETDTDSISYDLIATDLTSNFWIEHVNKETLLSKLDENGIDVTHSSKLIEFLRLLQSIVDKGDSAQLSELDNDTNVTKTSIKPSDENNEMEKALLMKIATDKFNWSFRIELQSDRLELDEKFKYQLFNSINIYQKVNGELQRQLDLKDRVIRSLLENFLELNNSYNSSMEDDVLESFTRKVDSNKQLNRIFPQSSKLRKSLFKYDYQEVFEKLEIGENIWQVIANSIKEKHIWGLSNEYSSEPTKKNISISDRKKDAEEFNFSSDFVNFDELIPNETSRSSSNPLKRRRIATETENIQKQLENRTPSPPKERKVFGLIGATGASAGQTRTPSPIKGKVFGVVGGKDHNGVESTPSRKRKLKAGTSSPIKAPRII